MEMDLKALTEATAGAVGSLLSTTILYPLDTCKTKYQAESNAGDSQKYRSILDVLKEAIESNQVFSLYQGLTIKNVQSVIAGFVYFYSYSFFKSKYLSKTGLKNMGTSANLLVGVSAGVCTCIITQPLDTLSSRMQTSCFGKAKSFFQILKERGISKSFDGLGVSLLLTCNPAIQYTVFEQAKNLLMDRKIKKMKTKEKQMLKPLALSAISAFLLGAFSKTVATVLTYPLIRCKVLIQRNENDEEMAEDLKTKSSITIPQAISLIWKHEGIHGFYKGIQAQILKTVLAAALMLMIKEKVAEGTELTIQAIRTAVRNNRNRTTRMSAGVDRKLPSQSNSSVSKLAVKLPIKISSAVANFDALDSVNGEI